MLANGRPWVIVLAGGVGSRFWPVSTLERPKQLLPLVDDGPLITDTIDRARNLVPDERIRILAGEHLVERFRSSLPNFPDDSYLCEPLARGTAPALAWAAWHIAQIDPDAVMVSLHADHIIRPHEAFRETVAAAVDVVLRHDLLVCIGTVPNRIEVGYGHVEPGEQLDADGGLKAYRVRAFHEKPDRQTAHRYVEAGHFWNTGIFAWKARILLEEIEQHAPEIHRCMPLLEKNTEAFFDAVPTSVIDRAVVEQSERFAVLRATFTWDDVGNWEALTRLHLSDSQGNVIVGAGQTVASSDNVVFTDQGSVVLFGIKNLVVIRTRDRTLVLPRERAADLKELLKELDSEA